jgi:L-rhamnose mutarotase
MNDMDEPLSRLLADTDQSDPTRCCFLLRVRPERLVDYVAVHQQVWPEMREALSRCGWRRYSLFLDPDTGLVVGYFEADDTAAAIRAMGAEPVDARWQAEMAQFFVQPDGGTPHLLPQYFNLA